MVSDQRSVDKEEGKISNYPLDAPWVTTDWFGQGISVLRQVRRLTA